MSTHPIPTDPDSPDLDGLPGSDGTVELSFDDAEAVDLQALADEVAEQELLEASGAVAPSTADQALQDRIRDLEKHEKEHQDKHHRLLADFANFRNRTSREIQLAVDMSERKLLLEILPVLDSFDRCLEANYVDVESFRAGVVLIQKQFQDALRRLAVEQVSLAVGDDFDALHAEALTTLQDPTHPDGAVVAVFEKGYLLRGGLLRPARVVVNNLEDHETDPAPDGAEVSAASNGNPEVDNGQ